MTKFENIIKLVDYIVAVPSEKLDEKQRFKYSSISCELLTSDINSINDILISHEQIIDRLYSFIDTNETLNPLLASYFAKVMGCLIKRNSEYVITTFFTILLIKIKNQTKINYKFILLIIPLLTDLISLIIWLKCICTYFHFPSNGD